MALAFGTGLAAFAALQPVQLVTCQNWKPDIAGFAAKVLKEGKVAEPHGLSNKREQTGRQAGRQTGR